MRCGYSFQSHAPPVQRLLVRAILDQVVQRGDDWLGQAAVLLGRHRNLGFDGVTGVDGSDDLCVAADCDVIPSSRIRPEERVDAAGFDCKVVLLCVLLADDVGPLAPKTRTVQLTAILSRRTSRTVDCRPSSIG